MFIGLAFNTFVHVPMYYYYFKTSLLSALAFNSDGTPGRGNRQKPTWGSHVTRLQIVQFSFSVACIGFMLVAFVGQGEECSGLLALGFNTLFNVTLLAQFVTLFNKKKSTADKAGARRKAQ